MVKLESSVLDILRCPACHGPLRAEPDRDELACVSTTCALVYPVRDDVPVLLMDEARRPGDDPV